MEGLSQYIQEDRPWGGFERFTQNETTTVKIITVDADQQLSLQTHEHRSEFWHILSGSGVVTNGEQTFDAKTGDHFLIPKNCKHRVAAGPGGVQFLEIAFGEFDEADITRLEDSYGRA
jgi:mannose-6-phosphate isomerase-like protein (cupin superfamily)